MNDFYHMIASLTEREKELKCLYNVDDCLNCNDLFTALKNMVNVIPHGWQYPHICSVEIEINGNKIRSPHFTFSGNKLNAIIQSGEIKHGEINIFYPPEYCEKLTEFLPEEQLLLNAIARRIAQYISLQNRKESIAKKNIIPHWEWRYEIASRICEFIPAEKFGISSIYIAGSTKNAQAGPASDIDLIVVHHSNNIKDATKYFEGWSHAISIWNEQRTGILQKDGLLDIHYLHENEIHSDNSWATMLRSDENSAKLIKRFV